MPRSRRLVAGAAIAVVALIATACGSGEDATGAPVSRPQAPGEPDTPAGGEGPAEPVAVEGVEVVDLDEPIALVVRPGDDDHLWVAERPGRILRLVVSPDGGLASEGEAVLDISDDTTIENERGLLSMTFSPDGEALYVSHTNAQGDSRVASYAIDGNSVDEASRTELLAIDQPFGNHNGGHIVWGPDDALWLGLGDGGSGDDPENRAQDPEDPLGSMVRIDPESGETDVVAIGLRNPWRFAFDPADDSLWIADVGQQQIEEVNRLAADEIDGANLGWSGYEGSLEYLDGEGRRPDDPVMPAFEYAREGANCSITGGFVYRGDAIDGLAGAFLFADYCAGDVRAVRLADDGTLAAELDLDVQVEAPISFGADADGEPFVLSGGGSVVRLVPAA
ncbi:PQQ-dependent sugar dehydrogenase [soil metagenome]